jgi:hypothetical protein
MIGTEVKGFDVTLVTSAMPYLVGRKLQSILE